MQSLKLSLKFLPAVITAFAVVSNARPNFTPLAPVGNIAPTPLLVSETGYYYQASNGAILEAVVSGPFSNSNSITNHSNAQMVPPGQAMLDTPIAACATSSPNNWFYNDVHVFYYDPNNLLSEAYWIPGLGLNGGPNCTSCIQSSGFFGVSGSKVLYAFEGYPAGTIRVGFISAGSPQTLSEAIKTPDGAWVVATMPN